MKQRLVAGLLRRGRAGDGPPVPYAVTCSCGQVLRGQRQKTHQVVKCPGCGRDRFVLPLSPLTAVSAPAGTAGPSAWHFWRWPLIAGGATAGVAGLALVLVLVFGPSRSDRPRDPAPEARFDAHVQAGQQALTEGAFRRAARELAAAEELGPNVPSRWNAQSKRLRQQQRQAALVADLLAESPVEIVRHAVGIPEAEWRELFQQRYAGRAVILDDVVRQTAGGEYQIDFRGRFGGSEVRFDLKALRLLASLALQKPRRLVFGFRLAAVRREPSGDWVLTPDPDSGVLITDAAMLTGSSVPLDADLMEVLKGQDAELER